MKRITIGIDEEAAALLPMLAGSNRKQGVYLSALIHQAAARQEEPVPGPRLDSLQIQVQSIWDELARLQARVQELTAKRADLLVKFREVSTQKPPPRTPHSKKKEG